MPASQVSTTIDRTNLMKTLHKELLEELHSRIAIRIEDIDDIVYGDEMCEYGQPKDFMISFTEYLIALDPNDIHHCDIVDHNEENG